MVGPLLPAYFLFGTTVTRGKRFCLNRVPLGSRFAAFLASALFNATCFPLELCAKQVIEIGFITGPSPWDLPPEDSVQTG